MSRINTNVSSMIAVNALNKNQSSLQTSLERLSTGTRINSGKDDPSGLIASESLKSESASTSAAISNAQQANNVVGTAEGALGEVSDLLVNLQSLVSDSANSAGLSSDELNANQSEVDSILSTVNRISNSTSFQGNKLLNGTYAYQTSGLTTTSAFTSVSINAATLTGGNTLSVAVSVVASAQKGELTFGGSSSGLSGSTNLSISGNTGTVSLSFTSATKSSAIVASVNQYSDSTGVKAVLSSDSKSIKFDSTSYGKSQFVSVTSSNSDALSTNNLKGSASTSSYGSNATLTVNGQAVTSDGLNVNVVTSNLQATFTLNSSMNQAGTTKSFGVTGGGANFSLGAQINSATSASIGIASVNTNSIGKTVGSDGKVYSLADLGSGKSAAVNTGDTSLAQKVVNQAISDVSNMRGRLGAFQSDTLDSTTNALNVALENVSASQSDIADTDFATETANLTRSQILVQSATSVLKTANSNPQNVLSLLG